MLCLSTYWSKILKIERSFSSKSVSQIQWGGWGNSLDGLIQLNRSGREMCFCHWVTSLIKSESVISKWRIVSAYQIIMVNKLWVYLACIYITSSLPPLLFTHSMILSLSAWLILHLDVTWSHRRMLLFCIIWFLELQL